VGVRAVPSSYYTVEERRDMPPVRGEGGGR